MIQPQSAVRTALVAVYNVAYSFDREFSYIIPEEMTEKAAAGVRVVVPFGRGGRKRAGLILEVKETVPDRKLKSLVSVVDSEPVISGEMMKMIFWLKENTFCTYYDAVRTILPSGMNIRVNEKYELCEGAVLSSLSGEELNLVCFLKNASSKESLMNSLTAHQILKRLL